MIITAPSTGWKTEDAKTQIRKSLFPLAMTKAWGEGRGRQLNYEMKTAMKLTKTTRRSPSPRSFLVGRRFALAALIQCKRGEWKFTFHAPRSPLHALRLTLHAPCIS